MSPYHNLPERDSIRRYMEAMHYSLIAGLSAGEIGPTQSREYVVGSILMVAGQVMTASTIALLADKLSQIIKAESRIEDKISTVNEVMDNFELPRRMRNKVRHYLRSTEITLEKQRELEHFLASISPPLRMDVLRFLFARLISSNTHFCSSLILETPLAFAPRFRR